MEHRRLLAAGVAVAVAVVIVVHVLNNCYAFAELEEWSAWQIPLLMAASLTVLALGVYALTSAGVLAAEPAPVGGHG